MPNHIELLVDSQLLCQGSSPEKDFHSPLAATNKTNKHHEINRPATTLIHDQKCPWIPNGKEEWTLDRLCGVS